MTVQEIQEIGFEKAVFGGYDMKSVDTFLERVAEEFAAMQKENAAMKAKMKVLVDKIEEYRGVEEGMHRTLLTAQSIAQETIDKAKKEAEEIIASAKDETANKVKDTKAEINTEEQKLETARKNTAEFIAHVAKLYQSQARALAELAKGENLAPVQQTGELRAVSNPGQRINEAYRLGFHTCIMPMQDVDEDLLQKMNIVRAKTVGDAIRAVL